MGRGNGPPCLHKRYTGHETKVMCASSNAAADMLVQQPLVNSACCCKSRKAQERPGPRVIPQDPCTTLDDTTDSNGSSTHSPALLDTLSTRHQHQHPSSCLCNKNTPYTATGGGIIVACLHSVGPQPAHHHSNTPTSHLHTTHAHDSLPSCRCTRGQHASATPHAHAASCSSSSGRSNAMQLHACPSQVHTNLRKCCKRFALAPMQGACPEQAPRSPQQQDVSAVPSTQHTSTLPRDTCCAEVRTHAERHTHSA